MAVADIPPRIADGEPLGRAWFGRTRPRAPSRILVLMSVALLAWAVVEVLGLAARHTIGAELYGVLVAALAVVAAALGLVAMRATTWQTVLTITVAALWVIVAIGGIAGVGAHLVGPVVGEGPVDPRPRPTLAPLAFTAMGVVGEIVLWIFRRAGSARHTRSEVSR